MTEMFRDGLGRQCWGFRGRGWLGTRRAFAVKSAAVGEASHPPVPTAHSCSCDQSHCGHWWWLGMTPHALHPI
jgi:hypothetical protein